MGEDKEHSSETEAEFSDNERLLLHQLRILEWQASRETKHRRGRQADIEADVHRFEISDKWVLTKGITLHSWQEECLRRWFAEGNRGTFKIVTGGGKTLLAMAIAQRLQNEEVPDLHIAVVVPTIVLMHQWYDELLLRSNLPSEIIGRLGGGYQESFEEGKRIMICVLVSASRKLPKMVSKTALGNRLLLVVDECHRAGATEMSHVLSTDKAFTIGLSATPERDEDGERTEDDAGYGTSRVGVALGRIIYELTYAEALKQGLIPPFTIRHFGLSLAPPEQIKYDQLSRAISEARSDLQHLAPGDARSGDAFFRWARNTASRGSGQIGDLAARMVSDTTRRKELLYKMASRMHAVLELIRQEFVDNSDSRIILFHESIREAVRLFRQLKVAGFPAIVEHSELPDSIREVGLDLFRKGIAQVLVSVRSLIEGFNVPAVDVGIIVASSSSVRQRIQSMGRVMRRHRSAQGEEKTSCIHVLYARGTVDEAIYGKYDWEHATGVDRNLYYYWSPPDDAVEQPGPPRSMLPRDKSIDPGSLKCGDVYPGAYEGQEFSSDMSNNITDGKGKFTSNTALAEAVFRVKGTAGKFRVTPDMYYVLVRVMEGEDDWVTKFVTRLEKPLDFSPQPTVEATAYNIDEWIASAKPGDIYPFAQIPMTEQKYQFRQRRGGVISKRIRMGEVFALVGTKTKDPRSGCDAEALVAVCRQLLQRGERVTHLEVNEKRHVLYRSGGQLRFVYNLKSDLEFPEATETL